jgi:hypothetical protein
MDLQIQVQNMGTANERCQLTLRNNEGRVVNIDARVQQFQLTENTRSIVIELPEVEALEVEWA